MKRFVYSDQVEITFPSIPFFFEPNFNATVKPLAAVLRLLQNVEEPHTLRDPVVYGEFLLKKVGNNFSGKGSYED